MSVKSIVEDTAEAVSERTATAGQRLGRFLGVSLVWTVAIHALTTYREHTVMWVLRAISRALTNDSGTPGYLATLFGTAAITYDATWTLLLGIGR